MPQPAIKGQAFADSIAEFTTPEERLPEEAPTIPTTRIPKLGLHMDASFNEGGLGAVLILVSPEYIGYTVLSGSGSKPPIMKLSTKR